MIPKWILTLIGILAVAMMTPVPTAQAGGKKLNFGGPLGTFKATRHGTSNQSSHKYQNNSKARARAAAKAKARRKAKAAAAAKRRKAAIAARKHKASRIRAAKTQNEGTGPKESNTAAVPSTAAILTKNDIGGDQEATSPNTDTSGDESVAIVDSADTSTSTSGENVDTTTAQSPSDDGSGCKRFVPEVGMTVSVDC